MINKCLTAVPTGQKKSARDKERSAVVLGNEFPEPSSSGGANEKGELPKSWGWSSLGKLSNVVRGGSPRPAGDPRYFGGGIPWITVGPITADKTPYLRAVPQTVTVAGKERSRFVEPGTLLLTNSGATLGVPKITLIGGCINDGVAALLDVPESLKLYLLYYLQTQTKRLRGVNQGAAQPNLNTSIIKDISVPLAPDDEQRRIVAEIEKQFTRLEAGVAALRRVQANLKRYRAAILKAACEGRLVPTEAELQKSAGRGQKSKAKFETGAELLARILTERRQNWQARGQYKEPAVPDNEKLASLPYGWTQATVEQMTSLVATGATPLRGKSDFWNAGNIPWVTSGALNDDFVTEAFEFITPLAIQKTNAKLFPAGTLLVALYGEGKTRGKVSELQIEAATNQACAALLFGSANSAMRPYLKVFLQNNYEAVRLLASGGVQPNLSLSIMKNTVVPLPPLAEQTRIVAEVERRLSVLAELESVVTANLQRATCLRQSILQKAFTGKL